MIIAAVETATAHVGCALWGPDGLLAEHTLAGDRRHAEVLPLMLDQACRSSGLVPSDIGLFGVDVGPGLFTGLRVGLAFVRSLSAALDVPAAGVTSLDAVAHPHRRRVGLVASIVDARRSEVFWALYRADGDVCHMVREPAVAAPDEVAKLLAESGEVFAVGDGARRYADVLQEAGVRVGSPNEAGPRAAVIAEMVASGASAGTIVPPQALYVRQADVRIGWEQIDGRVGAQNHE